jgi:hypothetical protein
MIDSLLPVAMCIPYYEPPLPCQWQNVHSGGGALLGAIELAIPSATVNKWANVGPLSATMYDVLGATVVARVLGRESGNGERTR